MAEQAQQASQLEEIIQTKAVEIQGVSDQHSEKQKEVKGLKKQVKGLQDEVEKYKAEYAAL